MKKLKFKTIFIALILLSFMNNKLFISSEAEQNSEGDDMYLSLTPHVAINIIGDGNFSDYGFPGTGSEGDPYRIEDLYISTAADFGIFVTQTTMNFTIENCVIDSYYIGIYVFDSNSTCLILNNTCSALTGYSIYIHQTHNSTLKDNICNGNFYDGILLHYSDYNIVQNNTCMNNRYGIHLEKANNCTVFNNTCFKNSLGTIVSYSEHNELFNNTFSSNTLYGVSIDYCSYNVVHHNYFSFNNLGGTSQGYEEGAHNFWYDVINSEGNFWTDYVGPGAYLIDGVAISFDMYPFSFEGFDDVLEPNDDFTSAANIITNTTYSLIACDDDYFEVTLNQSDYIEIDLDFDYTVVDLDLYLFDSTETLLAYSENSDDIEHIFGYIPSAGFYYIVIELYSGENGLSYDLIINQTPSSVSDDIYEDNDDFEEAAEIDEEGIYDLFYFDVDVFLISLYSNRTYGFTLEFDYLTIDLDIYLCLDEDTMLEGSENYDDTEYFSFQPENDGEYYLVILAFLYYGYYGLVPSEYTLTIEIISEVTPTPTTPTTPTPTPTETNGFLILSVICSLLFILPLFWKTRKEKI